MLDTRNFNMPETASPLDSSFVARTAAFIRDGGSHASGASSDFLRPVADHLAHCISDAVSFEEYVLLDWPKHVNVGDHAIWLGTQFLFQRVYGAKCVYAASIDSFEPDRLEGVGREVPVFLHGGGNFGDLWPGSQCFRERIIKSFPERQIIVLSQTFFFEDSAALARSRDIFATHPRLTIFLRDRVSLEQARGAFGSDRVRLAPDMAVTLVRLAASVRTALPVDVVEEELWLARSDKEQASSRPALPTDSVVEDWWPSWPEGQAAHGLLARRLASRMGLDKLVQDPMTEQSWKYFLLGSRQLLRSKRLVTDRLHGHILASLYDIPHRLLANSYHKNEAFVQTWTGGLPGFEFHI